MRPTWIGGVVENKGAAMLAKQRYYAAAATMAAHSGRPDLRAKALVRLVAAIGTHADTVGVYIHDGASIVAIDNNAARLLGGQSELFLGRPVLSLLADTRHAEGRARLAVLRSGGLNGPWWGPMMGLDGRVVQVRAEARRVRYGSVMAYCVEFAEVTRRAS